METLENRLQKKVHVFLYALVFLTVLLGLSVLLEGCSGKKENQATYSSAMAHGSNGEDVQDYVI